MSRSSPLDWEDRRDGWNPRGKRRKQAGALASDWQHPELTRTNSPIVGGISVFPKPSPATEAVEKSRGRETGKGGRFSNSPAGAGGQASVSSASSAAAPKSGWRPPRKPGDGNDQSTATQGVRVSYLDLTVWCLYSSWDSRRGRRRISGEREVRGPAQAS